MVSKQEIVVNIEDILSYLLSQKHNIDIRITFKKEKYDGYDDTSRNIGEEQTLDR